MLDTIKRARSRKRSNRKQHEVNGRSNKIGETENRDHCKEIPF